MLICFHLVYFDTVLFRFCSVRYFFVYFDVFNFDHIHDNIYKAQTNLRLNQIILFEYNHLKNNFFKFNLTESWQTFVIVMLAIDALLLRKESYPAV